MEYLLAWQNLIFLIPLGFGAILVVSAMMGLGDADGGHDLANDVDHDHDFGHDHDHGAGHDADGDNDHTAVMKALDLLGIGRVPLTIWLMILSFSFGVLGLISNTVLEPWLRYAALYGPISIGVAFVGATATSAWLSRLFARHVPTLSTFNITMGDFMGREGETRTRVISGQSGFLDIVDHEGNMHTLECVTEAGVEIAPRQTVVVIDYDKEKRVVTVLPQEQALQRLGVTGQ